MNKIIISQLRNGDIEFSKDGITRATINSNNQMVIETMPIFRKTKEELKRQAKIYNVKEILYKRFIGKPLTISLLGETVPVLECNGIMIGMVVENTWCPETITGLPDPVVGSALYRAEEYIGVIKNKPDVGGREVPSYKFETDIGVDILTKIENKIRRFFQ